MVYEQLVRKVYSSDFNLVCVSWEDCSVCWGEAC